MAFLRDVRLARGVTVVCAALALAFVACSDGAGPSSSGGSTSDAELLSEGKALYEQTCAVCHGTDLKGTNTGPPFLDPVYAPSHHSDESFFAAVENGAQPHHWDFGAMPPQPNVSTADVEAILAYVRSEQAKAGITEDTPVDH